MLRSFGDPIQLKKYAVIYAKKKKKSIRKSMKGVFSFSIKLQLKVCRKSHNS